jgi:hypothetical protein
MRIRRLALAAACSMPIAGCNTLYSAWAEWKEPPTADFVEVVGTKVHVALATPGS